MVIAIVLCLAVKASANEPLLRLSLSHRESERRRRKVIILPLNVTDSLQSPSHFSTLLRLLLPLNEQV
jgi:hypothetical protein